MSDFSGPGVKRAVEHNLRLQFMLEDVGECWTKLVNAAAEGNIANDGNLDQVNGALTKQFKILKLLEEKVDRELDMQKVGSTMEMGWALVAHIEAEKKWDSTIGTGLSGREIRKAENDLMAYQRDVAAARELAAARKNLN